MIDGGVLNDVLVLQDRINALEQALAARVRAEETTVSSQYAQSLISAITEYAILMLDPEGRITSWNAGAERIKGYRAEEIIGRHFSCFYLAEAVERGFPQEELRRAQEDGRFEDEGWRLRKDGSRFWANVVITPICDEQGKLQGFAKISRDLTERRQMEQALRDSERLNRILASATDAIVTVDASQRIVFFNNSAEKIFGYTAVDVIGKPLDLLIPEAYRGIHSSHILAFAQTGITGRSMYSLNSLVGRRASGEEFPIEATISQADVQGTPLYTAIVRDITERNQTEERLQLYADIVKNMQIGLYVWRLEDVNDPTSLQLMLTNAAATQFTGVSMEERIGDTLIECFPALATTELPEVYAQVARLKKTINLGEVKYSDEHMAERIYSVQAFPLPDMCVGVSFEDVTQRKLADEEAQRLQSEIIRMQQATLAELSTPLIPITDEIVVMPLIGALDTHRAQEVLTTLLEGVASSRAHTVILDITGVPVVDTQVANTLLQAAQAVGLLGAEVVLTGIRPEVAQTVVGLGINVGHLVTKNNLQSGIAYATKRSGR